MSRDLDLLEKNFRNAYKVVLCELKSRYGLEFRPTETVRTPFEQAKLYRKSRTSRSIRSQIRYLEDNQAPFLAHCLESVGPQPGKLGRHVTGAVPGLSWHQHGLACDAVWILPSGRAGWSTETEIKLKTGDKGNGYRIYADLCEAEGLYNGGLMWGWDWPHTQSTDHSSPLSTMGLSEIDKDMERKFG